MRILLCDDDILFMNSLKKYILEYFKKSNFPAPQIISYTNSSDLLNDCGDCDLLFLDIEMPGPNGIYVGEKFIKKHPHTFLFIVTSYSEYLDDAMRIQVFRYLSKPIDKHRLFRNLKDALQQYHLQSFKLPLETKDEIYQVYLSDIIMAERDGRNVFIYTTNNCYRSIHPLSFWVEKLQHPSFFQSHRSYIVNFQYIDRFDHSTIHLFNGRCKAYLSTRKYTQFRKALLTYAESTR